jgi:hypothetical protein
MKKYYRLIALTIAVSCSAPKINDLLDNKARETGKKASEIKAQIDKLNEKLSAVETGDTDTLASFLTEQDTAFIRKALREAYIINIEKNINTWIASQSDNFVRRDSTAQPDWITLPDQTGFANGEFYFVGIAEGSREMIASEKSAASARVRICHYLSEELAPRFGTMDTLIYNTVRSFRNSMTLHGTAVTEQFMEHLKSKIKYYSLITMGPSLVKENILNNLMPAVDSITFQDGISITARIEQSDRISIKNALKIRYQDEKIRLQEKLKSISN